MLQNIQIKQRKSKNEEKKFYKIGSWFYNTFEIESWFTL